MGALGKLAGKVLNTVGDAVGGAAKMATSAMTLDFRGVAEGATKVMNASPAAIAASILLDGISSAGKSK